MSLPFGIPEILADISHDAIISADTEFPLKIVFIFCKSFMNKRSDKLEFEAPNSIRQGRGDY